MAPSIAIEGSRVCAWTGYMLKPGAPSSSPGRSGIQERALRPIARAIPHSPSKALAIMGNYALDAIRSRVLNALHELAASVRKLRELAEAGKLKSAEPDARQTQESEAQRTQELDALGAQWEVQICAFENCVIKELPRHVREKLLDGEDSVSRAWVLRFKPRNSTVVDRLEPYVRFDIEAAGGWHRCITWDTNGPAPSRILTVKSLLQDPDWTPDWNGVEVAMAHAKQIFAGYAAADRTNLTPNEADIETSIRELIATNQPEWMPDGMGIEASQFALNIKEGTLPVPRILEVHALRRAIQLREEPIPVEQLVKVVLENLRRSGDLKLFSYRPIDETKEASYYYLAELHAHTTVNAAASETEPVADQVSHADGNLAPNIFRKRGDFWEVRFQGEPTPPAYIKNLKGMEHIHELLLTPGKFTDAVALFTAKKSKHVLRAEGPQHTEFAQGAPGDNYADPEALKAYDKRLKVLLEEIESAKRGHDEAEKMRLQVEKDQLLTAVREAVGPGGSLRKRVDPAANKARKAVSHNIKYAIEKLRPLAPKLADHLQAHIEPGFSFGYRRQEQLHWDL